MNPIRRIRVVDSHTGGEPTRLVIEGGPDLGSGPMSGRAARLRDAERRWCTALLAEPRGTPGMVGALLCAPHDQSCDLGVIYFNRSGPIGMCGHGTIGIVRSLAYLQGTLEARKLRIETPVGPVDAELHPTGEVTVRNVESFRWRKAVAVDVPGYGRVHGDVAWGGNWFFLARDHGLDLQLANVEALTTYAMQLRRTLACEGIAGRDGREIDHIELFAAADPAQADARNFVLCPDGAYDRSPCGTGTSAKLACLHADGHLAEGQVWRQQGIAGSVFEACAQATAAGIVPYIRGTAYVTFDGTLLVDDDDPFAWGIGVR